MEKFTKLLLLVYLFINVNLYAFDISNKFNFVNGISTVNCKLDNTTYSVESMFNHGILLKANSNLFLSNIATVPPTVTSQIYFCQNSVAAPLAAAASAGGILNWYGTNAISGTASATAPTPSTTTVGTISYYVSQTVSGIESSRSKIDVIVVADNGANILNFRCDPSQIAAADKASSVFFDWANNPLISNTYNYTYTIQGGPPVTGITNVSHVQVFGMVPGQSATLILTSATHPCVPSKTLTCYVPCGAVSIIPTFSAIPTSFCINEAPPSLPTTSTNGPTIAGTWSPSAINTTAAGTTNYVFTPDPVLSPCAKTKTLSVTVGPVAPNFSDFSICSGDVVANLNFTSPNGISGTWSPSNIVNTTTSASYTFTPVAGQPCAPTVKTINVTVNPSNAIVNLDWTVTDAFAKNKIVTVTDPVGVDYLYRLDDGPFQESPIFEYVSLGTHALTVANKNGCSTLTVNNVLVIDYPKYFTPNSDGFHDTWNIFSLEDQTDFRILIFDRYGKFLKEIRPKSLGWDGMYNGNPMPANDYWFSVEYAEQNISKIFKSHFSLKR
ncbi:T9SS type B sorting domain-containing protein [Flavobacterium sp. ZS1P70]|uniref:T9SS type B sorting domain-containing protein n=1 Tax=Flavobacterium zhoui TaxID=3230414 RepID=A0ABW6I3G2_9FLAO